MVGSSRLIPGWGWYVPQSYRGYRPSFYAPPVAMEPRLGLQYNYPYAWQMGITMPADASPLVTPSLGPFEGVVRSQERSLRLNSVAARSGVALLRKGKYRDAGLLLARAYRDSDDPINPLLLAEALFGLGKYQHAELVLISPRLYRSRNGHSHSKNTNRELKSYCASPLQANNS